MNSHLEQYKNSNIANLENGLKNTIKYYAAESKEFEKYGNLERALFYKTKEIDCIKKWRGKLSSCSNIYPLKIDLARSYLTASRLARKTGLQELDKKYLLKAHATLWKLHKQDRLYHPNEINEIAFTCRILMKNNAKNSSVYEKAKKRLNIINQNKNP